MLKAIGENSLKANITLLKNNTKVGSQIAR
ncbi:pseudouridine-5'-phosphate glycosidase [Anaerosphaera aminiphila]